MKYALDGVRIQTDGDAYWIAPSAVVIAGSCIVRMTPNERVT